MNNPQYSLFKDMVNQYCKIGRRTITDVLNYSVTAYTKLVQHLKQQRQQKVNEKSYRPSQPRKYHVEPSYTKPSMQSSHQYSKPTHSYSKPTVQPSYRYSKPTEQPSHHYSKPITRTEIIKAGDLSIELTPKEKESFDNVSFANNNFNSIDFEYGFQ